MAKFDSKNLEIRSKSVEQTLVPLVTQVNPGISCRFLTTHNETVFNFDGTFLPVFKRKKTFDFFVVHLFSCLLYLF